MISIDTIKNLLCEQIDLFRQTLEEIAKIHNSNLQHPEVIRASERLDILIGRYAKLTA